VSAVSFRQRARVEGPRHGCFEIEKDVVFHVNTTSVRTFMYTV